MPINAITGTNDPTSIDPTRSLDVGPFTLGPEAAVECIDLIATPDRYSNFELSVLPIKEVTAAFYWSLSRQGRSVGEAFGVPTDLKSGLPTAIEVALVKALHLSNEENLSKINAGGHLVIVAKKKSIRSIAPLLQLSHAPVTGSSALWGTSNAINLTERADTHITSSALSCFQTAATCAPLKFRFLELYRSIESRFLEDILRQINNSFRSKPKQAITAADQKLKSEMAQLSNLAESRPGQFELIWDGISNLITSNDFSKALFEKLDENKPFNNPKWKAGAALFYFVRCAVVHAGEKDLVFDEFEGGNEVLDAIMPHVEIAAFQFAGIEFSST